MKDEIQMIKSVSQTWKRMWENLRYGRYARPDLVARTAVTPLPSLTFCNTWSARRYVVAITAAFLWTAGSMNVLADGTININNGTGDGTGWTFSGSTLTVTANGTYTIEGNEQTGNRISVNSNLTDVNITLRNVNINSTTAFYTGNSSTVNLTLRGTNTLRSSSSNSAGVRVSSSTLVITAASDGSLNAYGSSGGAGIGGDHRENGGTIIINGGTITAEGNYTSNGAAAGIGSGGSGYSDHYNGGNITINGGTVTATCHTGNGLGNAGIGGGDNGGNITINGGTVTATGSAGSAGIGGSLKGHGCTITINGGTVTATGSNDGAGIGAGNPGEPYDYLGGEGGTITINGGTVTATSGFYGSAIGGSGTKANTGSLTINGGSLKMNNHKGVAPKNSANQPIYLNTLTLGSPHVGNNVAITEGRINGVACTQNGSGGYGIKDVKTTDNGKVYFYLTQTSASEQTELKANSKTYINSYTRANDHTNAATLLIQYDISLSQTGTYTFPAATYGYSAQTAKSVTVTNTGYNAAGALDVTLSGAHAGNFTLSTPSLSITASNGTGSFTIVPKAGLTTGTYTATVTVAGSNDISKSFNVSFTVNRVTPTAAHLDYDLTGVTYDGTPHAVAVVPKAAFAGELGVITVKYNGSTTPPPTAAGAYNVTADIAAGTNYNAVTGLALGTFDIAKANPTTALLDIDLTAVTYDGLPHAVAVAPKAAFAGDLGAISVKYNGSTTVPSAAGSYTVTADIAAGTNYSAVNGLLLGVFAIANVTPTAAHLDFDLTAVTYDGLPHAVAVAPKAAFAGDLGEITVKYAGTGGTVYAETDEAPTGAGSYTVTVDITAGTTFAAIAGLPLGVFTIEKAAPTVDDLAFNLDKIVYSNRPQGIDEVLLKDESLDGLGKVTVKYDGFARLPDAPGTYEVTIDIAEGANFKAVTGLVLGTFTITRPPVIDPLTRRVTLPSVPGATTEPPSGLYTQPSGNNFTFTLRPSASLAGHEPVVTTGRETDALGGVTCTPNGDGSYTVLVREVRQHLTLEISFVSSGANAAMDLPAADVWAFGNRLYIAASRSGQAYVYTLAGTLMKTLSVTAGQTTVDTLPAGIYIIAQNGKKHKIVVND
ncbi:MAG: MBG domain-containing protein [Tannerella sp.]|jgi:hypothetical protein|nr:MBG domain-containing protein [Tannerella sp.]